VPASKQRGRTGRFVPCPATRWRHPEDRLAFEVRWSARVRRGEVVVCFFFDCSSCTPNTRVFLNDWREQDGFTIPEAEAEGYRPKCTAERKAELLRELGLQQIVVPGMPWAPGMPPPPHMPAPARYAPIRKKRKASNPKK